jgi:RpiR family carbohydrate utilization transcriptional regulator
VTLLVEAPTPTIPGSGNLLAWLRSEPALSRSNAKIARLILDRPAEVTRMTLAVFASEAGVSQPTAIRFCRFAGCEGFPELKIRVAQALATGAPWVHREIGPDDDIGRVAAKVFASSIEALSLIGSQLDLDALARGADLLARADRIHLIATGLSSVAGLDAQQKLMRLGVTTVWHADAHLQRMAAATMRPGDVAIAFSYTGQIRDVVRTAEMALAQGAGVVGVTRTGSALARISTVTIAIDTLENTFVYAPMTTRLAHLVVVDVLATVLALRKGAEGAALIRSVKQAMRDEWLVDPARAIGGEPSFPTPSASRVVPT